MPLDTSTYSLALLRLDGRRWNELRRLHAQISIQAAADGSSYLEQGNTKVLCTVTGPAEPSMRQSSRDNDGKARIDVEINFAGFSGVERRRRGGGDKRTQEMAYTLGKAFGDVVMGALYPYSTITIHLHILSQDGGLLAACLNAATLALVDAGIPMRDYLVGCTAAASASASGGGGGGGAGEGDVEDPLLDLNALEEQELPFLTVGVLGREEKVSVLILESRVRVEKVEAMLAVGIDGSKRVREILDGVVKEYGKRFG